MLVKLDAELDHPAARTKQHQCSERGGLGPKLHLYSIILVDSPFVSSNSESLFCISAAWIFFPQKSSSRVETTETAGPGPSICVYAWSWNPPWTLLHNCWQRASHVWVLSAVWRMFILAVGNGPNGFAVSCWVLNLHLKLTWMVNRCLLIYIKCLSVLNDFIQMFLCRRLCLDDI